MCPYLHNEQMIAISLVSVVLSALSASAFHPAFCVGLMTAARAKATIVMYIDNSTDSKDKLISEIKVENFNLQFKMISEKIDHFAKDLKANIKDLKTNVKDLRTNNTTFSNDLSTLKTGLIVIACLFVALQLFMILTFFK